MVEKPLNAFQFLILMVQVVLDLVMGEMESCNMSSSDLLIVLIALCKLFSLLNKLPRSHSSRLHSILDCSDACHHEALIALKGIKAVLYTGQLDISSSIP